MKKQNVVTCYVCLKECPDFILPNYMLDPKNASDIQVMCHDCEAKLHHESNVDDSALTFYEKMIREKDEIIKQLKQRIKELENEKR